MNKQLDQRGAINMLLIPLIMSVVLLFGALGFGFWAFAERSDYKTNSDQKSEAAVVVAVERAKTEKDNEFLEREKEPLKDYSSPAQFGNFGIKYPKTWSAYVDEQKSGQLSLLLQPDAVSSNPTTAYAGRVEVVSQSYDSVLNQYSGQIKQGQLTATTYSLPKVPSVVGLRLDGQIGQNKKGSTVFLPLRDKTIKITTESEDRLGDFNNIILPNFTFSP